MNQAERLENLEKRVFGGPNVGEMMLLIDSDGPINWKGNGALVVITKPTAAALTLLPPEPGTDDGKILTIVATTSSGHTITSTFQLGTTIATLNAYPKNFIRLLAVNGVWVGLQQAGDLTYS